MWTVEHCMWYAPVGRFSQKEEGDWLRLKTENGTEQDVLRRPGERRDEWQWRALTALEHFICQIA